MNIGAKSCLQLRNRWIRWGDKSSGSSVNIRVRVNVDIPALIWKDGLFKVYIEWDVYKSWEVIVLWGIEIHVAYCAFIQVASVEFVEISWNKAMLDCSGGMLAPPPFNGQDGLSGHMMVRGFISSFSRLQLQLILTARHTFWVASNQVAWLCCFSDL